MIPEQKTHPDYPGHLVGEIETYDPARAERTTPELFEAVVRAMPNILAVVDSDTRLTYDQLNRRANQIAWALHHRDPAKRQVVGILLEHRAISMVAMVAVHKAGKAYAFLDPDYPIEQTTAALAGAKARFLLTNNQNLPLAQQIAANGLDIVNIDELPSDLPEDNLGLAYAPNDLASIFFTSGSTGQPKGVSRGQYNYSHGVNDTGPGDHTVHMLSNAFSSSEGVTWPTLLTGATMYLYDAKRQGLQGFGDWLRNNHITHLKPPFSFFREFVKLLEPDEKFPTLRRIQFSAQAIYAADVLTFLQHLDPNAIAGVNLGMSEVGLVSQYFFNKDTKFDKDISPIGYPTMGVSVDIVDEDRRVLPIGEVGEIAVRSKYLPLGYWQNEAETAQRYLPTDVPGERILYSGDLGKFDPDGKLIHLGRKDQMVKIRGNRVELGAVEAALAKHPQIADVAASAKQRPGGENYLVGYITPKAGQSISPPALREFLTKNLPSYMIPTNFMILESIPKTANGKPNRNALPEPEATRPEISTPYRPPVADLEKQIAKIWEDILGIQPVGLDDDYFELGGSSIQAMRLFVALEKTSGQKLPLALLLEASTVAQQAQLLEKENLGANWSPLITVQAGDNRPPLFCLPGVGGNVLTFHDLAKYLGTDQPIFALQSRGLGGSEKPLESIDEIAEYNLIELKNAQPEGPYYLCGSSFGGMVAYEMAQKLHDQGDKVGLVALFDTAGPDYDKRKRGLSRTGKIVGNLAHNGRKHLANLKALDSSKRRTYLQARMHTFWERSQHEIKTKYEELRYPLPADLKAVRKANRKAARHMFEPPRFKSQDNCRFIVYKASHQPFGVKPDATIGWGAIADGFVEIYEIEGYHDMMLWEPQIRNLGPVFKGHLNETQTING